MILLTWWKKWIRVKLRIFLSKIKLKQHEHGYANSRLFSLASRESLKKAIGVHVEDTYCLSYRFTCFCFRDLSAVWYMMTRYANLMWVGLGLTAAGAFLTAIDRKIDYYATLVLNSMFKESDEVQQKIDSLEEKLQSEKHSRIKKSSDESNWLAFYFLKGRDTRCDTSPRQVAPSLRQVASSALLLRQGCLRLFCRCDMSHEFKPVWIRATDRSDKRLSQRRWFSHVTRGDLSRRRVAAICRIVCLGLKTIIHVACYIAYVFCHFGVEYSFTRNVIKWKQTIIFYDMHIFKSWAGFLLC